MKKNRLATQSIGLLLFVVVIFSFLLRYPLSVFAFDNLPTVAPAFNTGANVFAIVLAADGSAYVGGSFTSIDGIAVGNIAHIKTDGTVDTSFLPDIDGGVFGLALSGSTLYAVGTFAVVDGSTTRNGGAAFNINDGTLTAWDPNFDRAAHAVVVSGSTVYVGGEFTDVNNGVTRNHIAAFNTTDGTVTSWDANINRSVSVMLMNGSTLFAGGSFTQVNGGTTRRAIAAFNAADGTVTAWDPGIDWSVVNPYVNGMTILDSTIYVVGDFDTVNNGVNRQSAAAFDLSTATVTGWDPHFNNGFGGQITSAGMAAYGSSIFVGARFSTVNNGAENRSGIAEFDSATGTVTSWAPDPELTGFGILSMHAIAMTPDASALYIGGNFEALDGDSSIAAFARFGTPTSSTPVPTSQPASSNSSDSSSPSDNPNQPFGYEKTIMAGPNFKGTGAFITGGVGDGGEGKIFIGSTTHHDDVNVTIQPTDPRLLAATQPPIPLPWSMGLNTVSEIMFFGVDSAFNGYPIWNFDRPATIVLTYDPVKLGRRNPLSLRLAYYDRTKNRWVLLPSHTVVDPGNKTVANTSPYVSTYYAVVYGNPPKTPQSAPAKSITISVTPAAPTQPISPTPNPPTPTQQLPTPTPKQCFLWIFCK